MSFRFRPRRVPQFGRRRATRGAYAAVRSSPRIHLLVPIVLGVLLAVVGFELFFDTEPAEARRPATAAAPVAGDSVKNESADAVEADTQPLTESGSLQPASDLGPSNRGIDRDRPQGEQALVPAELVQLAPGTSAAVVDLARYQMHVYQHVDGRSTKVGQYRVSIGENGGWKEREGDKRTPVGVYFIESYIPDSRLPPLYGVGAFPVNYPNLWDRRQGRTGSGIWVHGTEKGLGVRAPRSSRGCVTLANVDFTTLYDQVAIDTSAVIFAGEIDWRNMADVAAEREELWAAFESWRQAWQSRDTERYLSFYAQDFRSGAKNFEQWAAHKRRVNAAKTFIRVDVEGVGVFRYPGYRDLFLVDFEQEYASNDYNTQSRKRQYWRRGDAGDWRIVHEDRVR